jgi:eukaryotic-like serine/threonine-protein kinase
MQRSKPLADDGAGPDNDKQWHTLNRGSKSLHRMSSPSSSSPAESDLSGRKLGDFRLLRRLGRGAMAEVYLADQERLKRRVAVKILRPELAGDRTYLQRFELEAQAAASLVHANIVQIHEVGCADGIHYIAQEYVQGQNLADYIARHGPPDLPHALSIMRQVASALSKAAERGVVHRDIKPENIMLTAGGEVKVADFGLARLTREGAANDLTQIGITLGTPLYMSPEQVEGKSLDPRSDIYSFGVTCYHMLSGAPPFGGETALGVAVQHLKARPQPLEAIRPDLPPALCRIVHQMLAKDPAQRFATGRDLLRELRRVQMEHFGDDWPADLPAWESLSAEAPADPRVALTAELDGLMKAAATAESRLRRRAWWAAGLIAAFLVGVAVAWWLVVPPPLLADAKAAPPVVPKQPNVWRQWYLATQLGTEAGWQSVIEYFPENKRVALRADEQLALVYFSEHDYDRARPIFEMLAELGDEPELKAFGLAGQCGLLSLDKKNDEAAALLAQLLPIKDKLTSEPMKQLVKHVIDAMKKNRSKLGPSTRKEWDLWLNQQFREEN